MAILTALLVAPPHARLKIYTDSQAAISTFLKISKYGGVTPRKFEKIANYQAWKTIKYIISKLHLKVELIKVKGHSDDFLNNKADALAKQGSLAPIINIDLLRSPDSQIAIKNDTVVIESSIRRFWKHTNQAQQFSNLLNLQRNTDLLSRTTSQQISWPQVFHSLKLDTTLAKDSPHKAIGKRTFKFKLLTNELPTSKTMHRRRPDLFTDSICNLCNESQETVDHLWNCSHNVSTMEIISESTRTFFFDEYLSTTGNDLRFNNNSSVTDVLRIFDPPNMNPEFNYIARGIFPKFAYNQIFNLTNSTTHTIKIINNTISFLQDLLYNLIWRPRCEIQVSKEKSLGISIKDKKKKKVTLPRNLRQRPMLNDSGTTDHSNRWTKWITLASTFGCGWTNFLGSY